MLGIDRPAARYTFTLWLVDLLRTTIFVFTLALLFAYLLSPLVDALDRVLPMKRTRTLALALAYLIFLGVVVVVGIQIGGTVSEQLQVLSKRLPDMLAEAEKPTPEIPGAVNSVKGQLLAKVREQVVKGSGDLISVLPEAGLKFISVASGLIYVVIIPVLGFIFLKDGDLIRGHVLSMVDAGPMRALADSLMEDIHLLLAHYMRALVILSVATFTAYSIFFTVMRVPFGVLLALLAMCLEFIPTIGPLTASVAIIAVAAVAGAHVLEIVIFLVAYRMFQDYILSPYLMGQGVELHPLLVLFGVFGGAEVAGVAGSFLSVPVLAMVRIFYLRVSRARQTARESKLREANIREAVPRQSLP
jgi:predicted PurR-regulated permease PerM